MAAAIDTCVLELYHRPCSMKEAANHLQISERHLANLTAEKRVRTIRLGRCVRIPGTELKRLASEGCSNV